MKIVLARLLNTALFLAAWIAAFMALHWLLVTLVLETRSIDPAHVPSGFRVVVESRGEDGAPAYSTLPFHDQASLKLEPGESLHLSTARYDQTEHEITGSCCIDFTVLEDGPDGQLVEANDDDMNYVMSRYRVRDGQVTPLAHRSHFTLYYLAYFFLGGLLAWFATRPVRRRALVWARRGAAAT